MPRPRDFAAAGALAALLAFADGSAVPPRNSPAEYPAHQDAGDATIAAQMVPPGQASKLFTSDVSRKYIVVEVAVYPKQGRDVDIRLLDFELKTASGEKSYTATPEEVAAIWGQKRPELPGGLQVVGEAGVEYGSGTNPVTGRQQHGWGTYAGTGVGSAPPRYGTGPDTHALEAKLRRLALPEGSANRAIAGYMYFPVSKRRKDDAPELEYFLTGGGKITLRLPN